MSYQYDYPRPAVTVDIIVEREDGKILLIKRKNDPYKDHWALPGGYMNIDETLAEAASRELKEETNIDYSPYGLVPFGNYDAVDRDTRGRVITAVFIATVEKNDIGKEKAQDDAVDLSWFTEEEIRELPLAFDHSQILSDFLTDWS